MDSHPGTKLITTDIPAVHFPELREELRNRRLPVPRRIFVISVASRTSVGRRMEDVAKFEGADVLAFFRARLDRMLLHLPNRESAAGFTLWANALQDRAAQVGGMRRLSTV